MRHPDVSEKCHLPKVTSDKLVQARRRRLSLLQSHRNHGQAKCNLNAGRGREQRRDCCSRRVPLTQPHSQVQSTGPLWIQTRQPDVSEKCHLPKVTSDKLVQARQRRLSLLQSHRNYGQAKCNLNPYRGREQTPDCCSRRVPLTQPHSQVQSTGPLWI